MQKQIEALQRRTDAITRDERRQARINKRDQLKDELPYASLSETTSVLTDTSSTSSASNNLSTEVAVLNLFNNLGLPEPVTNKDISATHRLKKSANGAPAPVLVHFTCRKVKDAIYAAR